jgi:hypothetical protein
LTGDPGFSPPAGASARPGGSKRRPRGRVLTLALSAVGLVCVLGGMAAVFQVHDALGAQLQSSNTPADVRNFSFESRAWSALPVDSVLPSQVSSGPTLTSGSPYNRRFTRIAIGAPASCSSALQPALDQLLESHGCGPVIRADYTDSTSSLVATAGFAVLGTSPAQQSDLSGTQLDTDMGPQPLTSRGTAAASFTSGRELVKKVNLPSDKPYVVFAVAGFADGRPATADTDSQVPQQSGLEAMANGLLDQVSQGLDSSLQDLTAKSQSG